MGFFALAAEAIGRLMVSRRYEGAKPFILSILFVIASLFAINTYNRNYIWRDSYSLWSDVIAKSPSTATGYINLGSAYVRDEAYSDALPLLQKAKFLEPRNAGARYGLGVAYFKLNKYEEAMAEFAYMGSMGYIGIGNDPSISYYFSKIARNYYGHGRKDMALEVLDRALQYDPNETILTELKEKMVDETLTFTEIMAL